MIEIIEIKSHKELPKGVEMVLYEPPFFDAAPLKEVVMQFRNKYGKEPETIYRTEYESSIIRNKKPVMINRYWVVK